MMTSLFMATDVLHFRSWKRLRQKSTALRCFFGAVVPPRSAVGVLAFSALGVHFVNIQRKQFCRRFELRVSLLSLSVFKHTGWGVEPWASMQGGRKDRPV